MDIEKAWKSKQLESRLFGLFCTFVFLSLAAFVIVVPVMYAVRAYKKFGADIRAAAAQERMASALERAYPLKAEPLACGGSR